MKNVIGSIVRKLSNIFGGKSFGRDSTKRELAFELYGLVRRAVGFTACRIFLYHFTKWNVLPVTGITVEIDSTGEEALLMSLEAPEEISDDVREYLDPDHTGFILRAGITDPTQTEIRIIDAMDLTQESLFRILARLQAPGYDESGGGISR